MTTSLSTNTSALNAMRFMNSNSARVEKFNNQLSSGKIDPADNPSGAAVGAIMESTIRSLTLASNNITQAAATMQLAIGTLDQTSEILIRMKELAYQSVSTTESSQRSTFNQEFQNLLGQITANSKISWGTTSLLSGGLPELTVSGVSGTPYTIVNNTGIELNIAYETAPTSAFTTAPTAVFYPAAGSDLSAEYSFSYNTQTSSFTLTTTSGGLTTTSNALLSPSYDPYGTSPISDTVYFSDGSSLAISNFYTNYDGASTTANNVYFDPANATPTSSAAFSLNDGVHVNAHVPTFLTLSFQTGSRPSDNISVQFPSLNLSVLGLQGKEIDDFASAQSAMSSIDAAIGSISQSIANIGGKKSQMEFANANIAVSIENQSSAKATFSDADVPNALLQTEQSQELYDASEAAFKNAIIRQQGLVELIKSTLGR